MVSVLGRRVVPETWAIVPARSGSKSIPDKNLQRLEGHSLLAWAVLAGVATPGVSQTFISTDSASYANVARKYGATVPFLRSAELASDAATDTEVLTDFCQWALSEVGAVPKRLLHLRPTSPSRDVDVLSQVVRDATNSHGNVSAIRSVHIAPESPMKWFLLEAEGFLTTMSGDRRLDGANRPRAEFPAVYVPNGYVDVIFPEHLLDTGLLHGESVRPFITPEIVEVDDPHALEVLRAMRAIPDSLRAAHSSAPMPSA